MTVPGRPRLLVFDVNETLSDMSPLAARFEEVGAPASSAQTWFAELLRDGFALTVSGAAEPFASLAEELLRARLEGVDLDRGLDAAVDHVLGGLAGLGVHPDVPEGIGALADLGIRMVTLSNGSTQVAETLLEGAGVRSHFSKLLSVEGTGVWKPARGAYEHALGACGVDPADAMLVAVHPWDVDGASRARLRTAWINRSGGRYPAYFTAASLTATSLTDLAEQLS